MKDDGAKEIGSARLRQLFKSVVGDALPSHTHISEFARAAVGEFGGMQGLAREVYKQYTASKSEHAKARLLSQVLSAVVADTTISGKASGVDSMTGEEMVHELVHLFGKEALNEVLIAIDRDGKEEHQQTGPVEDSPA